MAFWEFNLDWFGHLGWMLVTMGRYCEAAMSEENVISSPALRYTLAFALQLRKIRENLSQGRARYILLHRLGPHFTGGVNWPADSRPSLACASFDQGMPQPAQVPA
jgi:hypothetical protein